MELDARMDDLECRQAFQDDTLQALNDVVVEQQRSIERLQLQVAALIKRLEDVQAGGRGGEDEAPPPHY